MNTILTARLLRAACSASSRAYAPYSGFKVGAALLDEKGRVHAGCNVENSSYGLTICAERAAICKAVSAGAKQIRAIAVYAQSPVLTYPCGACLQVIFEFGPQAEVILSNGTQIRQYSMPKLLPCGFRLAPARSE